MKILFSGGGTLGPVTPLLAIHDLIKDEFSDTEFFWIGTSYGPEKDLIVPYKIPFFSIVSAKLRRYFAFSTVVDIFKCIIAFFQSLYLLIRYKPDLCISAGGFTAVPVHLAASFLRIPTWIHQQDVEISLTNKLLAPFSTCITVALEKSLELFPKNKTSWIGNPVREEILQGSISEARKLFSLNSNLPVVLVLGGGTGAQKINELVSVSLPAFQGLCQIIHITGKDKSSLSDSTFDFYHSYPFFTFEMKHAYAAAHIIVSRAGFGTLSEVAALKKPLLVIPIPGHQEKNAEFFESEGALRVCKQNTVNSFGFVEEIRKILENTDQSKQMAQKFFDIFPRAKKENLREIVHRISSGK